MVNVARQHAYHHPDDPEGSPMISHALRSLNKKLAIITGTGYCVYEDMIIPEISKAESEVILVTCFWAPSVTLTAIGNSLRALSTKAIATSRRISVHICFSSSSLPRNMLWRTPPQGQNYPAKTWSKLGLPNVDELTGLDLRVTRKFYWPFGIIHSKYVIVDKKVAMFPSCNVSWERWFEICLRLEGTIVDHLLSFHTEFWENDRPASGRAFLEASGQLSSIQEPRANQPTQEELDSAHEAYSTLLPSPHSPTFLPKHLKPRSIMSLLPCMPIAPLEFPPTPLLTATHRLLSSARISIVMLTPNLTEPVVLDALTRALERGVHITIFTNRTLMTVEQVVTAGTTTPRCIRQLQDKAMSYNGVLRVIYFDDGPGARPVLQSNKESSPVKLHAKVTIVDAEGILLGSCNMDAASWGTSQELGVLVESKALINNFVQQWPYGDLDLLDGPA